MCTLLTLLVNDNYTNNVLTSYMAYIPLENLLSPLQLHTLCRDQMDFCQSLGWLLTVYWFHNKIDTGVLGIVASLVQVPTLAVC